MTAVSPDAKTGDVYTRRWVAEAILDLVGYTIDKPLERCRIVEPAVGDGSFLRPILDRLLTCALGRGVPLTALGPAVRCWDIDEEKVGQCRLLVTAALVEAGADLNDARHVASDWVRVGDYLLHEAAAADFVVGNPPYIRWDDLGAERAARYRDACTTIRGRGDIYLGFWERALASLRPGGRVGFICADRWMRNSYGADLRSMVGDGFDVETVWSMHDVDAFEEKVSAYPAITVIGRATGRQPVVVTTTSEFAERGAAQAARFTLGRNLQGSGVGWKGHRLDRWYTGRGLWPSGTPETLAALDALSGFPTLEDAGCTVGIGLATGCDARFVVDHPVDVEPDRLLPLVKGGDLNGSLHWNGHYLVNPWAPDGKLVNLNAYPRLRRWLNVPEVRARFVANRQPASWYRTIDKVIAGLAETPKLLIADMRPRLSPYLDHGGLYPHHNLYWVTSEIWDLNVLGGLLLSDIAATFVEAYCVRMHGGTLRLQAQYLRTIRVPQPGDIAPDDAAALADAFIHRDRTQATAAARKAYLL